MNQGQVFKAATFAASKLDIMTAKEFAAEFTGKLHSHDGSAIDQKTLKSGFEYAQEQRAAGNLDKFKVSRK